MHEMLSKCSILFFHINNDIIQFIIVLKFTELMMCPSLIISYKTCFKELLLGMLHLEMYAIKYMFTLSL